jgi:hypothetical protein
MQHTVQCQQYALQQTADYQQNAIWKELNSVNNMLYATNCTLSAIWYMQQTV